MVYQEIANETEKMKKIKEKLPKGFLDRCLIFCAAVFVLTAVFGAVCFVVWQSEPTGLYDLVRTLCGAEGLFTMAITIAKLKKKEEEEENDENTD